MQQNGTGTTILTADNTYSGGTTINAGTLQLGNGGTSGSIVGDVLDNGTFAVNRSDTYTFGGVISGSGAFAQIGPGTTILTAANTYAGGTAINAGVLAVAADANLGAAAGGLAFGGGTLQFLSGFTTRPRGRAQPRRRHRSTPTATAPRSPAPSAAAAASPRSAPARSSLSGANSYSGGTTLAAGTLRLESNLALGTGALTTTGSVVRLCRRRHHRQPDRASTATPRNCRWPAAARSRPGRSPSSTARARSRRSAPAPWCSPRRNSYSGPTTVSAGALVVNGSIANSAVTVNAGALLAGTGTVGATTITSGGTFAPGPTARPAP